mmetsp:Transcript_29019/g.83236  ORF Transcript_29019/g.83236 Transcript_29019/m.83236 type:complete len:226 (-) Transcript_29019:1752-2429(-)
MMWPRSTACFGCWAFQSFSTPGSTSCTTKPKSKGCFFATCKPKLCPMPFLRTTSKERGTNVTNCACRTSSWWRVISAVSSSSIIATSPFMSLTETMHVSGLSSRFGWPCWAHAAFHSEMVRSSSSFVAQIRSNSPVTAQTLKPPRVACVTASSASTSWWLHGGVNAMSTVASWIDARTNLKQANIGGGPCFPIEARSTPVASCLAAHLATTSPVLLPLLEEETLR